MDLLADQQTQISLLMARNEQLEGTVQRQQIQITELADQFKSRDPQNSNKAQLLLERMPGSCEDLWYIGHRLNGFYDVQGDKEIRSVYCDFTKLPGAQGNAFKCQSMNEI